MISVRITDEEYERLKLLCESNGGSISDLTRDAVRALSKGGLPVMHPADPGLVLKIHNLERNLASIRQFLSLPTESDS